MLTAVSTTVIGGSPLVLNVSAVGCDADRTYIWEIDFNDGNGYQTLGTTNEPTFTVEGLTEGIVNVRVTVNACNGLEVRSNELEITIIEYVTGIWIFRNWHFETPDIDLECLANSFWGSLEGLKNHFNNLVYQAGIIRDITIYRFDETNWWLGNLEPDGEIDWWWTGYWRWTDESRTAVRICDSDNCAENFTYNEMYLYFMEFSGNTLRVIEKVDFRHSCFPTVILTYELEPFYPN